MTTYGNCGCTTSHAAADALALGFQEEFETGAYTCCQLVAWADEQWLAWSSLCVAPNSGGRFQDYWERRSLRSAA
jgi:hypothetical protein